MSSPSPKKEEKRGIGEEKKYVQLPPETVQLLSEASGIDNLNPNISRALSEDVSYRTRELAHVSPNLFIDQ